MRTPATEPLNFPRLADHRAQLVQIGSTPEVSLHVDKAGHLRGRRVKAG